MQVPIDRAVTYRRLSNTIIAVDQFTNGQHLISELIILGIYLT